MPTDVEFVSDVSVEKYNSLGLLLSVCMFGAHVALFCRYLRSFYMQKRRSTFLFLYTILLFSFATVAIALQIWWTLVAFIDNRYYPGGPQKFLLDNYSSAPNRALTVMYLIMNWLADGLILYRFYVIFACTLPRKYIALLFVVPCSTALVAVAMIFFSNISSLGINLWSNSPSLAPGIAYMALSLSINTILTLLIIIRLLQLRRVLFLTMGPSYVQTYTSVVALLVESAALYTILALMTVITCGVGSPIQYVLLPMLGQLQAIPPVLITSRVAEGRALSRQACTEISRFNSSNTVEFSPAPLTPSDGAFSTRKYSSSFDSPIEPITPVEPALKFKLPRPKSCRYSFPLDLKEKGLREFDSSNALGLCEEEGTDGSYQEMFVGRSRSLGSGGRRDVSLIV